ncbi:MAG: geranylgeranyl reductase family protein, partial [Anaerolineaceae bacterium]
VKKYDLIIVGAGPAGSVLGYLLAKNGFRVLILEKTQLPRYKTCGGGVTYKSVKNLPFDATSILDQQACDGIVAYQGTPLLKTTLKKSYAWLVMRDEFDYFLASKAQQAGAELIDSVPVEAIHQQIDGVVVQTSQGNFCGLFVAGADGVNSTVARSLNLLRRRQVGTALEAEVEVPPPALEQQGKFATFDFGAMPYGYGWIFPKRDHLSVGVFQAAPHKATHLRQSLQTFIKCQPVLSQSNPLRIRGHPIPLGGCCSTLHQDRVLLLGDAANLADPWLGEGIYYAIASARIAATVLEEQFAKDSADLSVYTQRVNSEIAQQLVYAKRIAKIVYRFPKFCSLVFSKSSHLQELVFDTIRGDLSYRALYRSLIQSMPGICWQVLSFRATQNND